MSSIGFYIKVTKNNDKEQYSSQDSGTGSFSLCVSDSLKVAQIQIDPFTHYRCIIVNAILSIVSPSMTKPFLVPIRDQLQRQG